MREEQGVCERGLCEECKRCVCVCEACVCVRCVCARALVCMFGMDSGAHVGGVCGGMSTLEDKLGSGSSGAITFVFVNRSQIVLWPSTHLPHQSVSLCVSVVCVFVSVCVACLCLCVWVCV